MILKPPKGAMLNRGHPLARGLVGCWLMNEGSGSIVNDLSGNGLNGAFSGTAPSWLPGDFGPTVNLPGTDEYIIIPAHSNPRTAITFVMYAKSNQATWPQSGVLGTKLSAYTLYTTSGTTRVEFYIWIDTVLKTSGYYTLSDITQWHQYVGTFDGTNLKMYVDGVLQKSSSNPGAIDADAGVLTLGKYDFIERYLNGQIGYSFVYNRALSPIEILNLYRSPFCMFEVDL